MVGNSPCHATHRVCLSDESQWGNGDTMNHFGVSKGSHLMTFCDCEAWEGAVTLGIAQLGASTSRLLMFPGAPAHQTPGLSIFFLVAVLSSLAPGGVRARAVHLLAFLLEISQVCFS